ncbi:MAG: hypothetical protein IRY97_12040 [Thermomicrobiaceae bacterium]|nr:hypothetical protein [Thermomicrobiaceae bacterium]
MRDRESGPEAIVPVAVASSEAIAELWRGALADEGITAMIKAVGPGAGFFSSVGLQFVLYTLASDEARAREILADLAAEEG